VVDKPSTKIAMSDLDKIEQLLDQVQAPPDTFVSKQRAIGILAPRLHAMRAKGYSWSAVAAWLMEHGINVSPVALQGYLRRVRMADASEGPEAIRKRRQRAQDSRATRSSPARAAPLPAVSPLPAKSITPPTAAVAGEVVVRRNEPGARRSEFVVRPDSKDI
jgi:hypothetical protein